MKTLIQICMIAMLHGAALGSTIFTLFDTQHKDVTAYYLAGSLYDSSSAAVLGGSVRDLSAFGTSGVTLSSGLVNNLYAYDTSTAAINGGGVFNYQVYGLRLNGPQRVVITGGTVARFMPEIVVQGTEELTYDGEFTYSEWLPYGVQIAPGTVGTISTRISVYDQSVVTISNGTLGGLFAYDNSTIGIAGGSLDHFEAYGSVNLAVSSGSINRITANKDSHITISGGYIGRIDAYDLRLNGPTLVTITDGTVGELRPYITLVADEHLDYQRNFTLSDLALFGVQAEPGTVGSIDDPVIIARDNSSVNVSGGSLEALYAYDSGSAMLSGGNVASLFAYHTGSILINGFDFQLSDGLSWGTDGVSILGTGLLKGYWFGQTESWITYIEQNDPSASIRVIPEPGAMTLFMFGSIAWLKRRRTIRG